MHKEKPELAGQTVKVNLKGYPEVKQIKVEDWWDRLDPAGWLFSGRIAAIMYARRVIKYNINDDNEVLYGHSDGLGYLFNVDEIIKE